jgi:hypothetical protein
MGLAFAVAAVTTKVNVDGSPAVGAAVGGVITSVGDPATFTVILPEA